MFSLEEKQHERVIFSSPLLTQDSSEEYFKATILMMLQHVFKPYLP